MINAKRHTQAIFVYAFLQNMVACCYKENPQLEKDRLLDELLEVKQAEIDPKKADANYRRALKLVASIISDLEGENSLKIMLATNHLLQAIINNGYEIFQPDEYAYTLFNELLGYIDPATVIDYDKKDRKAKQLATKWLEFLNKEGYFL
jgi:hypothetical protein